MQASIAVPQRAAGGVGGRGARGRGRGPRVASGPGLGQPVPEGKLPAWWRRIRGWGSWARAGGAGAPAARRWLGSVAGPLVAVTKSGAALCARGRPPPPARVTHCGHLTPSACPLSGVPAKVGGRRNYCSALFPLHVFLKVPPAGL